MNYDIDEIENNNRQAVFTKLKNIPNVDAPGGWKRIEIAVGGLMYIGFSDIDTKKLICISSQGQSVINCETGGINFYDENYDELELNAMAEELGEYRDGYIYPVMYVKLLYNCDYREIVADAKKIIFDLTLRLMINPNKLSFIDKKVVYAALLKPTENEKNEQQ